jgi:osmotically-inducible protein OsmY
VSRKAFAAVVICGLTAAGARGEDLSTRVSQRLAGTIAVNAERIGVRSQGSTVFLEGTVGTAQEIAAAVAAAEATEGVEIVVNRLSAATPTPPAQRLGAAVGVPVLPGVQQAAALPAAAGAASMPGAGSPVPGAGSSVPGAGQSPSLARRVADALKGSGELRGFRVAVKAEGATIRLGGRVGDERQAQAAEAIVRSVPGVQGVVNELEILPPGGDLGSQVRLAQAVENQGQPQSSRRVDALAPGVPRGAARPIPMGYAAGRPMGRAAASYGQQGVVPVGGYAEPAIIGDRIVGGGEYGGYGGGAIVPGSERIVGDSGGMSAGAGGGLGAPMPMMPGRGGANPVTVRGEGPNMPNYAWPSYAAHPNYAALQYPTQYSPTAWPYIGPFYPYPQVPLGWRRVSLEWDDGWWWLDFDDDHYHKHH